MSLASFRFDTTELRTAEGSCYAVEFQEPFHRFNDPS